MKYKLILCLLFFLSCKSYNNKIKDFEMINLFYNKNDSQTNQLSYNSKTGILIRRSQKVEIKLEEKEIKEINEFYEYLEFKNLSVRINFEDSTYSKSKIIFGNLQINDNEYVTDKLEIEKHHLFNTRILFYLRAKQKYREAFPSEFEVY